MEQITETPVSSLAEEITEQRIMEQITETPAISLAEEIVEAPKAQTQEERIHERTIDVPVPHVVEKTSETVKLIPPERVQNCTVEQIIDVPVVRQGRVPATQTLQKVLTDRVVDVPVVTQRHVPLASMPRERIPERTVERSIDTPVSQIQETDKGEGVNVPAQNKSNGRFNQIAITNGRPSQTETDYVIQEAKNCKDEDETNNSKIETKNGLKNYCVSIRNTLIDERHDEFEAEHGEGLTHHVADPSCRKRKGSDITQSPRVRAFTRTHDTDDRREIFIGDSASTDETEEDIRVHAVVPASSLAHGELVDTKSEMECWRKELNEMKKMLQFLVRRERKVDMKTEVAAKRLQRLEREREEEVDKERESSLKEALADKTKVVKLVIDKWFVDKGFGFGKVPTGETIFIHASAVHGGEVLKIGTDAWVQVVNDEARAKGGIEHGTPGDKVPGSRRKTGARRTGWLSK